MPESAIAHDADYALVETWGQAGRAGKPQPIAHNRVANIEGRQSCKGMATNIGANMSRTEFFFQNF